MAITSKRLAALVRRRDRLASELAALEPEIQVGIIDFSRQHGFCIPLRIEQVRPMLGMDSTGVRH